MGRTQHIDIRVHTGAPAKDLYALLRDGASWPRWTPIDSFRLERAGAQPEVAGAIWIFRRGRMTGRDQVAEMIAGRRFSYRHLSGLPVGDYRGDVDLEPAGHGTNIRWHISFTPMIPGTGWLLRSAIRRFAEQCAQGLAGYAQKTTVA